MLIPIAKILNTHGLKGEVKVSPLTSYSDIIFKIKNYYFSKNKENSLKVESVKKGPGSNIFLVKFKDVEFEDAKNLKNQILFVDIQELPPLEEDEFYYYEILNLKIIDKNNKFWGEVKEILPVSEYELLLVKSEEYGEFYIPLVEEYIEEIDFPSKTIVVKKIRELIESQKP